MLFALVTLLLLDLFVEAEGRKSRFEPLPKCPHCVPREDHVSPGIGFDLTFSYATAAIRYADGRIENLVKVCLTLQSGTQHSTEQAWENRQRQGMNTSS